MFYWNTRGEWRYSRFVTMFDADLIAHVVKERKEGQDMIVSGKKFCADLVKCFDAHMKGGGDAIPSFCVTPIVSHT